MTFKSYKVYSIILFLTLFFVFQIQSIRINQPESTTTFFSQNILPFIPLLISLSCLYLSLYALFFKIESKSRKKCPITIVGVLASFLVLIYTFVPPTMGYFSLSNTNKMTFEAYKLEILKLEAFIPDKINSFSKNDAQLIFRKSGESVEYIDKNKNNVIYVPDQSDKIKYKVIQNYYQLNEIISATKYTIIINAFIIFFTLVLFIFYLSHKLRQS